MAEPTDTPTSATGPAKPGGEGAAGSTHHPEVDWIAAERSPEFQALIRKRRSFVLPALTFTFVWYFGFIALASYAPDFMGERITGGFTIGYAFALSQFVMTWVLGGMYLRRADRDFDPLARKAAEAALKSSDTTARTSGAGATPPPGEVQR